MKRSLIILSLLAAAGMAHAATPVYSWEWTAEGAQITAPNWNGSFNYTSGNDYATFGSGSGTPYNANITGITGSFTVSFDLKNLSSTSNGWKDIFSLYTNGTVSGESNSMVLEFADNGELYFYNKGFGGQTGGNINTGLTWTDLQQDNWNNLSIISDLSSQTLSIYVNGALAGTITEWNPSSPALTGSQFGASFGNTRPMNGTLDVNNIKFYNGVVLPVPEASTVSLGLLGLAALMMRRRRCC
ncbi:LamG-like jellyroll fold domain-containing protein [uncultured Akkermansia sp.]|uniref:LamG-like jellyroll fold domain-containing protein n=1 Tax=uncultured Akkermansia sp. TaxID=512294 RepID=UPI00260E4086|nr:LamG-like jellyroll fold domain-containing protein [uncultured Akkermansia sp.]